MSDDAEMMPFYVAANATLRGRVEAAESLAREMAQAVARAEAEAGRLRAEVALLRTEVARVAEAEKQVDRLERVKADLCNASLQDSAAARTKIEELGTEVGALQARLAAVGAAAEQAAAVAERPAWGEGTIVIDFDDLCPEYNPGPAGPVDYVVPQIRLDAFGFVPAETRRTYYVAAAQRPNGAPLRGWGRPVGPRTSEFFVWTGSMDRLPALHIRNAPPSYTPIYALIEAMEQRNREAAEAEVARLRAVIDEAVAELPVWPEGAYQTPTERDVSGVREALVAALGEALPAWCGWGRGRGAVGRGEVMDVQAGGS